MSGSDLEYGLAFDVFEYCKDWVASFTGYVKNTGTDQQLSGTWSIFKVISNLPYHVLVVSYYYLSQIDCCISSNYVHPGPFLPILESDLTSGTAALDSVMS